MTETTQGTDLGIGLAVAFGALAVLAAVATTATAYASAMNHNEVMQTMSGLSVAAAMLFAGLAITALHIYGGERGA